MRSTHKRIWCMGLLLFYAAVTCPAQSWYGGVHAYAGRIYKHKPELLFDIPKVTTALSVDLTYQTNGQKAWQAFWGKPQINVRVLVLDFGDDEILGRAHALMPGLAFFVHRQPKTRLLFQVNVGIAYLNRPFDAIDNPINNAIGSHINNATQFGLYGEQKIARRWWLRAGAHFVHFSNGLAASPNSGINVYAAQVGLQFEIDKAAESTATSVSVTMPAFRRFRWNVQAGWGIKELSVPDGPKFPVYTISFASAYHFNAFTRIMIGYEYEFSKSNFFFFKYVYDDVSAAHRKARNHIAFAAYEMFFGRVSTRLQTGVYLLRGEMDGDDVLYFKLNTNVFTNYLWHRRIRLYGGVLLKSHFAVADYVALVAGVEF